LLLNDPALEDDNMSIGSAELTEYLYTGRKKKQALVDYTTGSTVSEVDPASTDKLNSEQEFIKQMQAEYHIQQLLQQAEEQRKKAQQGSSKYSVPGLDSDSEDESSHTSADKISLNKAKVKSFMTAIDEAHTAPRVEAIDTNATTSAPAPVVTSGLTKSLINHRPRYGGRSIVSSASSSSTTTTSLDKAPQYNDNKRASTSILHRRRTTNFHGKKKNAGAVEALNKIVAETEVTFNDSNTNKSLYKIVSLIMSCIS